MNPEIAELVQHWTRRADGHLIAAATLQEYGREGVWDAICYHSHEAVAIYLKALHTLNGISAPRTHDIEYLHRILPESCRLDGIDPGDLACLSTFGIERWWEPDADRARRAVRFAERVREAICSVLVRAGITPGPLPHPTSAPLPRG